MSNSQWIGVLVVVILMAPSLIDWVRNLVKSFEDEKVNRK